MHIMCWQKKSLTLFLNILSLTKFCWKTCVKWLCDSLLSACNSLQCDSDEALKVYFDFWTKTEQTGPVFFGGGCSGAAESMSRVSNYWHTVHVGWTPLFSFSTLSSQSSLSLLTHPSLLSLIPLSSHSSLSPLTQPSLLSLIPLSSHSTLSPFTHLSLTSSLDDLLFLSPQAW